MLKKFLPLILTTGVIALISLSTFAVFGKQKYFPGPDITPPAVLGISSDKPKAQTAIFTKESGEAFVKLPDQTEFSPVTNNETNVPNGTTIKTTTAQGHVLLPTNSLISLSTDTEIVVEFDDSATTIKQILGNTWHRVEKVLQGHAYQVETPNTLATVRGTEFNVSVKSALESEIYVIESVVDVTKMGTSTPEVQQLTANQHVFINQGEMEVIVMPEEKKNTEWFKKNKSLTEEIQVSVEKMSEQAPVNDGTTNPDVAKDEIRSEVIKKMMLKQTDKTNDLLPNLTPAVESREKVRGETTQDSSVPERKSESTEERPKVNAVPSKATENKERAEEKSQQQEQTRSLETAQDEKKTDKTDEIPSTTETKKSITPDEEDKKISPNLTPDTRFTDPFLKR